MGKAGVELNYSNLVPFYQVFFDAYDFYNRIVERRLALYQNLFNFLQEFGKQ